jgi:diguanylate cyclase (GGDEF)-like protein/PAS domain S-box-containing protein
MKRPLLEANLRVELNDRLPVLSVSDGIEALLGFKPDDFLSGRVSLKDRIHPHDLDIAALLFSPVNESKSGTFNIRLRHADDRIHCIKATYTKEVAPGGGAVFLDLLLQNAKSLWKHPSDQLLSAHFRAMMKNTDDLIFFKDRNHVFIGASQNMLAAIDPVRHGPSLLGLTDYDIYPEEYADIYYRLEKQVFAGMPVAHEVHESQHIDGTKGWSDNRKYPIRNEAGEIVGLFGVARDATERIQAIEALRESEAKFRSLVECASNGIFVANAQRKYVEVNAAACKMLGYTKEELLTMSISDIVAGEEQARIAPETGLLEASHPTLSDWKFCRKDGTTFLGEVSANLLPDGRLLAIVHDVTERRRVEGALRESEASLVTAQAHAHLGNWELDLTTLKARWSAEMARLFYCDPSLDAPPFAAFVELLHPEDRAKFQDHFNHVQESDSSFDFEYRTNPSLGPVRHLSTTSFVIRDDAGRAVRVEGTTLDVTERKRAEETLAKSSERLSRAQQVAKMGFLDWDLHTNEILLSDETCRLYGIAKTEFQTTPELVAKVVHPDDRELVQRSLHAVLQGKGAYDLEHRIIRPDGTILWTHSQGELFFDAAGEPKTLLGTTLDITARKLAEIALRESEESLKESQRIAGLGSYVVHIPAGMWTSSEVMDGIFGIGKEYVRTVAGWLDIVHPDDRAMMDAHFADDVLSQGKPFDKEYRIVRQNDRAERWVHGRGILEFDAKGRPLKMRGTIKDITESKLIELALRESKELLELFIEHAPVALTMLDREMRHLAVSRRYLEINSLVGQQVIGRFHYEVLPGIPESWKETHRRALNGETVTSDGDRLELPDGSVHWRRWAVRPWLAGDGSVGGIVIFTEDITQQKQAEERLRLAASVFTHAREGIMITDADSTIIDVNGTFTRITGYSREEVLGRKPSMLSSGLHGKQFYAEMWRTVKEKGQWSGEIWNRHKNGEIFAEMLTVNASFDNSGEVQQYVALFSDITVLKENERKLERIAHYDVLTNLPNRALLADRLHQAMAHTHRRKQRLAVAFLDLDGFKAVNDHYGHATGDQLLTALAARMKQELREGDTLARLGGDEFVAVLLDLGDMETSVHVLNRLLLAAAEPIPIGDIILQVSASVGVTFYPQPENVDADQLLRQADQAMYQAKLTGGNRFHIFDSSQDRILRGHHEDIALLRKAMAANEFVLYYQPKVNMRTGAVLGAEALIRWQHPERGLLPPSEFLPIIENHLLAVELGEWVIDTALAQKDSWHAIGLEMPVSVNLSAVQLQQPDFADRLRGILAAHPGVKPSNLELEVLETSALQDVVQASNMMIACGETGVSFALDDFGTGYSSLTYLKRLPVKTLKIDQSFVRGVLNDVDDLTIVEGVLLLAMAFSRQVVAEGVESVAHGLKLLQLGCELAQGFGISHPMPASDLPAWVAAWRPDCSWANAPKLKPIKVGARGNHGGNGKGSHMSTTNESKV